MILDGIQEALVAHRGALKQHFKEVAEQKDWHDQYTHQSLAQRVACDLQDLLEVAVDQRDTRTNVSKLHGETAQVDSERIPREHHAVQRMAAWCWGLYGDKMYIRWLVRYWAGRVVAETCAQLEWRLSQARSLTPGFLPEVVWEREGFNDETGKTEWKLYSETNCIILERALLENPEQPVSLKERDECFTVWLDARKHVNAKTSKSTRCRRRVPVTSFVTIAPGTRQYLLDLADPEMGFRGRLSIK